MRRFRFLTVAAAVAACGGSSYPALSPNDAGVTPPDDAGVSVEDAAPPGTGDAAPPPADAGPVVAATIIIDPATKRGAVPAGFVGLSYEKAHLLDGFFRASNAPLVALLQRLGPSVLRVGGNSVDRTEWGASDAGAPLPDGGAAPRVTASDVDGLAAITKAAGWKVIYGVDMKMSTPAAAADEAAYAAGALGGALAGFEIGNEVDLYKSTLLAPTWSYATFDAQWGDFADAIRARVGTTTPLTGPASASHYATWTVPFAADRGGAIELLTQHYYRANGQLPTSTIDLLLAPDPNLVTMLDALDTATRKGAVHGGYRLAECNSFYNGGASGVSDAYGTALWAIDFLFTNAMHGSSGVNFHGGGNGPGYTPIADASGNVVGVRPVFYGMLLFTMAGQGPIYATKTSAAGLDVTAYAVGTADGKTSVVVVNKDRASTLHATIDAGRPVASASAIALRGPALEATSGVTLGGATIAASGSFTPAPETPVPVVGSMATIDVPPASVALVYVR